VSRRNAPVGSAVERRLWRSIARLPANYRVVWRLSELSALGAREIAARLRLPLPDIRGRLRHARLMLRRLLREEFGEKVRLPRRRAPRI
jgi:DNA-directed RNA polymerase specialized sigma24 family protein